jgi:CDP-diacylglycerol---glycerol-3-phosphate 3-phosphatidyltransferase
MFTLPNFLSLMRMPLALLFFQENPTCRGVAIVLAMLTDGLDGYLARRYQQISRVGTWLDPLTDKLFVLIALGVLLQEERLQFWQAAAFMGRDFAVVLFGIYLAVSQRITNYHVRAIWWGKITTALQFVVLLVLVFYGPIPDYWYMLFIVCGLLAFRELYQTRCVGNSV